jgi:hypothetical protein
MQVSGDRLRRILEQQEQEVAVYDSRWAAPLRSVLASAREGGRNLVRLSGEERLDSRPG